jgi:hypothetical protein
MTLFPMNRQRIVATITRMVLGVGMGLLAIAAEVALARAGSRDRSADAHLKTKE